MFKRLRNKFLILNMAMISVLLLSAFSMVYAFTYNQTQRNIEMRISRTLDMNRGFNGNRKGSDSTKPFTAEAQREPPTTAPSGPDNLPPAEVGGTPREGTAPFQLALDFTIETNADKSIRSTNSIFDIEDQVYEHITALALAAKKESGILKFEDTHWAFRRKPLDTNGFLIAFLDISREKGMLNNLILTLTGVGVLALLVIFLISRLFANRAIRPIEMAWEKQNQFIADASHELKTPLTTINTNVDVLLSHPASTIEHEKKWLTYIKTEAGRMTRLTNDLLYLTRLGNEKDSILRTAFSLSEAVQMVLLTMEAVIFEKNVTYCEEIEENLTITGNPDQIKQLTMILLDNAIKYTAENGEITVILQKQEKRILLSISNTGKPILPETQEKIFDRFYRADQSRARRSGGHGLGLSIAKELCQQNNAQISVKSQNGINTFQVIF